MELHVSLWSPESRMIKECNAQDYRKCSLEAFAIAGWSLLLVHPPNQESQRAAEQTLECDAKIQSCKKDILDADILKLCLSAPLCCGLAGLHSMPGAIAIQGEMEHRCN